MGEEIDIFIDFQLIRTYTITICVRKTELIQIFRSNAGAAIVMTIPKPNADAGEARTKPRLENQKVFHEYLSLLGRS
jgi:hypothetical protein